MEKNNCIYNYIFEVHVTLYIISLIMYMYTIFKRTNCKELTYTKKTVCRLHPYQLMLGQKHLFHLQYIQKQRKSLYAADFNKKVYTQRKYPKKKHSNRSFLIIVFVLKLRSKNKRIITIIEDFYLKQRKGISWKYTTSRDITVHRKKNIQTNLFSSSFQTLSL